MRAGIKRFLSRVPTVNLLRSEDHNLLRPMNSSCYDHLQKLRNILIDGKQGVATRDGVLSTLLPGDVLARPRISDYVPYWCGPILVYLRVVRTVRMFNFLGSDDATFNTVYCSLLEGVRLCKCSYNKSNLI